MKRSFITGLALEDDQAQTQTPEEIDVTLVESPEMPVEDRIPEDVVRSDIAETELVADSQETEDEFEEDQENEVVLESLQIYKQELQAMITNKKLSMESIRLIEYGIKRELGTFGYARDFISLEENVSLEDYAGRVMTELNSAMEGFLSGLIAQPVVIYAKKKFDQITGAFQSTKTAIAKYEKRIEEAVAETKHSDWKGKSNTTLNEMWDFFLLPTHPTSGSVFTKALKEDTQLSTYVLTDYTKKVMAELEKGIEVLAGKDAKKAISAISNLKTPVDLFDKKYLTTNNNEIYFGGVRLEPAAGMSRFLKLMGDESNQHDNTSGTLNDAKKTHGGMLAAPLHSMSTSLIMEYQAFGRGVATTVFKGIGEVIAANRPIEFEAKDVAEIAKSAQTYLHNATEYMKLIDELSEKMDKFESQMKNAEDGEHTDEGSKEEMKLANATLRGLVAAIRVPATRELSRSIRGARYCAYLIRRINHYAEDKK